MAVGHRNTEGLEHLVERGEVAGEITHEQGRHVFQDAATRTVNVAIPGPRTPSTRG